MGLFLFPVLSLLWVDWHGLYEMCGLAACNWSLFYISYLSDYRFQFCIGCAPIERHCVCTKGRPPFLVLFLSYLCECVSILRGDFLWEIIRINQLQQPGASSCHVRSALGGWGHVSHRFKRREYSMSLGMKSYDHSEGELHAEDWLMTFPL